MMKPRIGGHPVHIMLAHFPSAFFPLAVVCSTLFYATGHEIPGHVAFYSMAAGVFTAALAIIFGIWEAICAWPVRPNVQNTILWHAALNATVTIFFLTWALKAWKTYPIVVKDSLAVMIVKWIVIGLLFAGNYFGGKLLLTYHIGMEKDKKNNNLSKIFNHFDP
jgi:uncharacterized membrane protein